METYEVYFLCPVRTKELGLEFLDCFLPVREDCADDYPYPEYTDSAKLVYDSIDELLGVLETDTSAEYSLYWRGGPGSNYAQAMLFFTNDGNLVVGLAVYGEPRERVFTEIAEFTKGAYGYVDFENVPALSKSGFMSRCNRSNGPKAMDGRFVP